MTLAPATALDAPDLTSTAAAASLREFVEKSGLRAVVIGHSKDPNAKLTIMLVSPRSGQAELAVKAPTSDLAAQAVEAEMSMLLALREACPDCLGQTVPRVVDVVDFEGRPALVTTAVAGTPMTTSYLHWRHTARPAHVARDLTAAGSWLARLQQATAHDPAPMQLGAGVAARLRERFPAEEGLEADLERLAILQARLGASLVPRCAVHGDFWIGNVLLSRGEASGVVDWETGAMSGEPARDLVRFALMYAQYLDRRTRPGHRVAGHPDLRAGTWGAGVQYAIDGRGWFPDLFRRFLREGLRTLGASPDCWRDAALVGLAEIAAFTDDPEFGHRHLELFRRLSDDRVPVVEAGR